MADKAPTSVAPDDRDRIDYDGYVPESYMDRHVIRHLRHMRDKEYTRLAWRNCKDYSEVYQRCTEKNPFLAPFVCRDELAELKVCINRQMVRQRESAVEIDRVPVVDPSQRVDIDTVSKQDSH